MLIKYVFHKKILFVCLIALLQLPFVLCSLPCASIRNVFGDSSSKGTVYHQKNSASTYITLNNGMEFVLIENHSNPMIASVIVVKAGSKNETLSNNGVSHMLEHLLFNGTKNRTQEEIYDQMDFYGGYNNAHTAKDFTNFMILLPAEHIDNGLDIQADMLFNSVIPEEKLEKERGVVIEEIGKAMDREDYINRIFFGRKLYEGTSYALPVLGTTNTISNLTRSQIVSYYNKYYVPNNMIGMIIGEFDTPVMVKKLKKYFGHYPPKAIPFQKKPKFKTLNSRSKSSKIFTIKDDVTKIKINVGIKAPTLDDPDFYPFTVLNKLLNDNGDLMPGSNINKKKDKTLNKTGAKTKTNGISRIHSEYVSGNDIGSLNIFATLQKDADAGDALHDILLNLNQLSSRLNVTPEDIRGIKTKIKTEEFFLKERMHYYGMSKANMLANGGHEFMESHIGNIERVTLKQVKRVARKYLAVNTARFFRRTGKLESVNYVATIVEPLGKTDDSLEKQTISSLHGEGQLPETEKKLTDKIIKKEVFDNGLTLITEKNSDSRVFAVHVLFKDRAFHEPDGKTGIADFLHRLVLQGTTTKDGKEIEKSLNSIGARLTLTDNPYIPYDDYRTTSQFSFARLETIDDFYEEGLELIADLFLNPDFNNENIEQVRKEMINTIQEENNSVYKTARNVFFENLFNKTSLSKRSTGTVETVSSITRDDLINFHKKYFAPNNMIINVVSNIGVETLSSKVLSNKIKELFGGLSKNSELEAPGQIKLAAFSETKEVNLKRDKGQSYIFMGYPIPHVEEQDHAAIVILSSILSNDMSFRLREEQGLAYSLGCSMQTLNDIGWFYCNLGTRSKNIETARDGILKIINEYRTREFDQRDVEKTINKLRGRMMMRRLPRINQAYYAAIYEFYKGDYSYDKKFIERLNKVTPDDVKRVVERYLQTENYLWVVIE
ncbi:MAG: M16 family metallopeptidase [Candidatus Anammoxibacter sp.]